MLHKPYVWRVDCKQPGRLFSMQDVTLETPTQTAAAAAPFGTVFSKRMPISYFTDGHWSEPEIIPVAPLSIHPGAHVLHYSSTCFEGMKAFRKIGRASCRERV